MTHDEYFEWLFKIGTGWLGYLPSDLMDMNIQHIELAWEGLCDKLDRTFGGGKKKKTPPPAPSTGPQTKALFKRLGAKVEKPTAARNTGDEIPPKKT